MTSSGSGPYEGTGADDGGGPPRSRSQGPLVQFPFVPLVQEGPSPRIDLSSAAGAIAERFGLDPVSFKGPCPLPGHDGRAQLSDAAEDPTGDLRLLCCRGRWRSLGEVRAAIAYRFDNARRTNIEIAVWTRRLAYEVGVFRPAQIAVPPLAPRASSATKRVREGYRLLLGLRWADGPHRPVAFAVGFVAAWCGVGRGTAHAAIRVLIESGVIREVERRGRLPLYLPGPMPEEAGPELSPADEDALIARFIEAFDAKELPLDSTDGETGR